MVTRRVAAVLALDVVGYSRRMADNELRTLDLLHQLKKDVLTPAFDTWRGLVFKEMGDGFLAEFASVVDAVECANDIQETAASMEPDTNGSNLQMRIGIHFGEVVAEGDDLFGDTVNIAARIESAAEPGRVWLSEEAYRMLGNRVSFGFDFKGPKKLKNIPETVRLYALVPGATPEGARRKKSSASVRRYVLAGLVGAAVAFGLYMYLAPEPWQTTVETTSPLPGGLEHADIFSDCADCPSMVAIGGGQLLMGAPADDITKGIYTADQGPQRLVSVAPFAIGQYEVTKAQYTAFLSASDHQAPKGCRVWADGTSTTSDSHSFTDPGYEQEETHPAVCVSWNDAKAYVDWLSRETGESYRLLSEAEWEFAARAGSNARFFFGEDVTDICRYDNIGDATALSRWPNWETASCSDGRLFTSPVGTYEANGFGLYDLYGNAREWVQDCWFNNFKNAPETAKARDRDGCERRAIRGGSWDSKPSLVGSTWRWSLPAEHRDFLYGFRVARDLR